MKKKIITKEKKAYSDNHVMVMLETLNEKFDLFGEQQQTLIDRFDCFEKETDKNFKVIFKYLSKIDDEIQEMKDDFGREKKENPGLVAMFEKRMKKAEEDLKICKRVLALK